MTSSEGSLEELLRIARRRKAVILQALLVVPLIALGLSLSQAKEYTATSTLLFRQSPLGLLADSGTTNTFVDPTREAATNDQLVGLPVVAEQTAEDLGGGVTSGDVIAAISVEPSGEADVAKISATTDSGQFSAQMADAYAKAYIEFRRKADQTQLQDAIDLVNKSLDGLTAAELAGTQGQTLQDRLDRLELAQALQTGQAELVQTAGVPTAPSAPQTKRNVILGIILGGLLGVVLAALLERVDRRIRTVEELEELYSLPILARIPRSRSLAGKRFLGRRDLAPTPEVEAFRTLRANLHYLNAEQDRRTILIVSPEPGDGKSTVAGHLAMTMAEMGDDVLLVEADLHKGEPVGGGEPARGLSSVLAGMPLSKALVEVETTSPKSSAKRTLAVLPSGAIPPNPSELLESERMRLLIAELQRRYETVIIDSPALGVVSDALAIVSDASEIVIVSGLGATTRDGARNLMKQLSILGARPSGVIANLTKAERVGYSYYRRGATSQA